MSKKEICAGKTIAYYAGLNGIEIKHVEYGIEDYLYAVSGCHGDENARAYHRLKVYYTSRAAFVRLYGHTVSLNECLKKEV